MHTVSSLLTVRPAARSNRFRRSSSRRGVFSNIDVTIYNPGRLRSPVSAMMLVPISGPDISPSVILSSWPYRRRTQAKRGRCGRIPMDSGVATPCPWPGEIKHRRRPGRRQCLLVVPTYCHWPIPHLALVGAVHRRIGAVAGESRWTAASRPHGPGVAVSNTSGIISAVYVD